MKILKSFYFLLVIITLVFTGCKKNETGSKNMSRNIFKNETNVVKTVPARRGIFFHEIFNNGTLRAEESSQLTFRQTGEIIAVNIRNGQKVSKGDLLVQVEDYKQRTDLKKAELTLGKCRFNLEDALITAGYSMADSANVPEKIMMSCVIKSGYASAQQDILNARRNLAETSIRAPFDGIVSDCEVQEGNQTSKYKFACILLDDERMEVDFPVLESEYRLIKTGEKVLVTPFANSADTLLGAVTAINPSVDEQGMILVTASVNNPAQKLIAGMNVRVIIRINSGEKLIIPREAVIIRQERNVVFTVKNDTAIWNYVKILDENSRQVAVDDRIKEGDKVVVSGHLNLAHLARVNVSDY